MIECRIYFIEILWELHEIIHKKSLGQGPSQSKYSIKAIYHHIIIITITIMITITSSNTKNILLFWWIRWRGQQTLDCGQNLAHRLVLKIKFILNMVTPIYLHIVYGWFCAAMLKLNICKRIYTALKGLETN